MMKEQFKFDTASYTAAGRRGKNEDSHALLAEAGRVLALLADGVGGCMGGELASGRLIESLRVSLEDADFSEETLEDAIFEANHAVLQLGGGPDGPKSTLAMLWLCGEEGFAANVGDSRIYQFRDGAILFQSEDHSVPQLAVRAGEIRPEEIREHKHRNMITRCIGREEYVSANIERLSLRAGDRFLLCSDGFWEPVLESDMLRAAAMEPTAEGWLERMKKIAYANENDNHTAIALLVSEEER